MIRALDPNANMLSKASQTLVEMVRNNTWPRISSNSEDKRRSTPIGLVAAIIDTPDLALAPCLQSTLA